MAQNGTVAVLGASGRTGRRVVDALARRGTPVRAVTRSSPAPPGAREGHTADLADEGSLVRALEGAAAVYVIPPVYRPDEDVLIAAAARAAARARVGRVVLHSVLHPYTATMPHHVLKAVGEDAVRRCGVPWTIVQPAMYVQTVSEIVVGTGDDVGLPWDPDAPMSAVHLGDVAEAAANILTGPGHEWATYELAGPERLGLAAMVQQVADVTGRPLRPHRLPPGGWSLFDPGSTEAETLVAMCREYTDHGLPGNPNVLSWLLGRPATRFADAVRADLARLQVAGEGCR
ncbi:SDR family oxidoreductase [Pseudonocardia abyssalis]|uniref:NAD(P)H-binding protein n=1 Tax=Pseudonocardia abyssalis TaxID=2792008 RepID=A0ABS6UYY0_9PSEU|nr:NAD(P)H-binding protein [Pseudonocardia abyssalis]MBW0115754.1 NAD(P)H-binding protein [Pseudonocardia abyssalis]MBW0137427.1 NAD(P)H-binding protein [Pseudonocardia abyssalis]